MKNLCRWGILGTAGIARKNWRAIWNAGNATIAAIASRDIARARQFIGECQTEVPFDPAPVPIGDYQELLNSADIDAVYIPLPTGLRREWILKAARAGKHVLAEKPSGRNTAEVQDILDACRTAIVQYMDGVMFMHSARFAKVRELIRNGDQIGALRRIASQFSFLAADDFIQNNIRLDSDLEPLGCLGDLGWYNIRWILGVMDYATPIRVTGRMLSELKRDGSAGPVPMEFSGEMFFSNDVSATFYCSFVAEHQQWIHISGTKGNLFIDDFVLPYFGNQVGFDVNNAVYRIEGCTFNMEKHSRRVQTDEYSNGDIHSQESKMISHFSELALADKPDPKWGEYAIKTQRILDAVLQSARQENRPVEL